MPLSQAGAVTGRRYPSNYVAEINARSRYLPTYMQAQKDDEYRSASLAQEAARLSAEKKLAEQSLALQEDQAKKANLIGLGNLAASTYYGFKSANPADVIEAPGDSTGGMNARLGVPAAAKTVGGTVTSALTDWGNIGTSGLAGFTLGPTAGKIIPFGGDAEKAAMGGALVGTLASGFKSGWDPVSMITGAITGGAAGWLSDKSGFSSW